MDKESHITLLSDVEEDCVIDRPHARPARHRADRWLITLNCILLIIVSLFAVQYERSRPHHDTVSISSSVLPERSEYAELARDQEVKLDYLSDYWSSDETIRNRLWENLDEAYAYVALDDSFANARGLERSGQRFPWDANKGVYLVSAFHQLHCLKMLYYTVEDHYKGRPISTTTTHGHILHCLSQLRQDVECQADDTPLIMQPFPDQSTGHGQRRKCRSIDALTRWSNERTACYSCEGAAELAEWNRTYAFSHCPKDSPYNDKIREHFSWP